jgi:hypothetical protein
MAREIALARSAAPASISDKAAVMILKPQGYAIAVNGTNGFTCLVEVALRQPGVLESEDEGARLLQPGGLPVDPRVHVAADAARAGPTLQGTDARSGSRRARA